MSARELFDLLRWMYCDIALVVKERIRGQDEVISADQLKGASLSLASRVKGVVITYPRDRQATRPQDHEWSDTRSSEECD